MVNPMLAGLAPMHPGELLREDVLPALERSKAEIARLLHVSRTTLYDILAERQPITPAMAMRLAKLTATDPKIWLNMQQAYDLAKLEGEMAAELEQIPTLQAA